MSTEASLRELKTGFERLSTSNDGCHPSGRKLLWFYAVECGLKYAVLRRRGLRSTGDLDADLRSHDLARLAKELCISKRDIAEIRACGRSGGTFDGRPVPARALHEAWRYGIRLDEKDEKNAEDALENLIDWCRKELP